MTLPTLFRWHLGQRVPTRRGSSPSWTAGLSPMDRLLEELLRGFDVAPVGGPEEADFAPQIDLVEEGDVLRVTAELPGLDPSKDFEVELIGDRLTLKGEKRLESEDRRRGYVERAYGSFHRAIQLPCEVDPDQVSAAYKDGVLTVTLPKPPEAVAHSRRIDVTAD